MGLKNDRGTRPRAKQRRFGLNRHRHGDEMGCETERVLASLKEKNEIAKYHRYRQAAKDDGAAARFTVTAFVDGKEVTAQFGITVSRREWHRATARDDGETQFCFPLGTRPETIRKRILALFSV